MRIPYRVLASILLTILACCPYGSQAHDRTPESTAQEPIGGFVPGQKRPPIDHAVVTRGKTLYGISCQGCHGQDLRGGDMGGPNLLRSTVALTDLNGENIVPVIQGSRQAMGMPRIPLSLDDSNAVAAYVRSIIMTIGRAGKPPSELRPVNIVAGDAKEGSAYFASTCSRCHSSSGDLQGIASQISSPKALQNAWVTGGAFGKHGEGPAATATITQPSGQKVQGSLVRIDDFIITIRLSDGTIRTFTRNGNAPKVVLIDPLQAHKDLLPTYTDKEIHDVTAYLVTLK